MSHSVSDSFERGFLEVPLQTQIDRCGRHELASLLLQLFKNAQPVLEAGCGSGCWNGWLGRHAISSVGLDWSAVLCRRAADGIPECSFLSGDMRNLPLRSGSLGGVMALGSVEHSAAGPLQALKEFHRVLRVGGVALVTVPYGGWLRRTSFRLWWPVTTLKSNRLLRRLLGKSGVGGKSARAVRKETVRSWFPRFAHDASGCFFYEYEFNKVQMRRFVAQCGFHIEREFVAFGDEGILHNFGRLAAVWNTEQEQVDFTVVGKLLRKLLPVDLMGHMLCYVITKQ